VAHKHFALTKDGIADNIATGVTGCYAIFFASFRTKYYIGSSKCIRARLHAHRRKLEKGTHKNRFLQGLFNRYPNEVRWSVVFTGDESSSRSHEQVQIDFNIDNLYNMDNRVVSYKNKRRRKNKWQTS